MEVIKSTYLKLYKMKNIFKNLILVIVIAVFAISCDEDETTYDSLNYPSDAFIAFESSSTSVPEGATDLIDIPITFATTNQSSDVTVNFSIESSDMILGTHYEIVDNKTSYTISSGSYTDKIQISLIDNADKEEDKQLTITLTDNNSGASLGYPGPDSLNTIFTLDVLDDDCEREEALRPLAGTWSGTDSCGDYDVEVLTELPCGTGIVIKKLGHSWLEDPGYWGEVVEIEYDVYIEIDEVAGTVNIPEQKYVTTSYSGSPYDYTLVGSGTIDTSGAHPVMHIVYDMLESGTSMALTYGGSSCPELFEADLTLN